MSEYENIKIEHKEILAKVGKFEIKGDGPSAEEYKIFIDGKFVKGVKQVIIDIDARTVKPVLIVMKIVPDEFELIEMGNKKEPEYPN